MGTVTVGTGAGPSPFYLERQPGLPHGRVCRRPFGLAIVVRALAGPFDLGTVVIRAGILVDPETVQLKVVSDPLPRILRGVPLRLRDVHLAIDRPGFMVNPTSCRRTQVRTTITAVQGGSSSPAVPYQVGSCAKLAFSPSFSVALVGRGQTTDGKRPGLRVRLRSRLGQANLRTLTFTLPPQIAFDASRGGPGMCRLAQLAKDACPRQSRVGTAAATSPLLAGSLTGPVYFIRGVRGDIFPKLALRLDGALRVDLLGSTKVTSGGVRTTFPTRAGRAAELLHDAARAGPADADQGPLRAQAGLAADDARPQRPSRRTAPAHQGALHAPALGRLLAQPGLRRGAGGEVGG